MTTKERGRFRKSERVGVRWRLFACLILFTFLILLVLWLFQVRLLSTFYAREKFSELKKSADELEHFFEQENADARIRQYAASRDMCVLALRVENREATMISNAEGYADCLLHHMNAEMINQLYEDAKANGGVYDQRFRASEEGAMEQGAASPKEQNVHAVHVEIIEAENAEYVMFLDCEMTPVATTVRTLERQFIWIAGALIVAAFFFALILSRIVASPLIKITQKAERLAAGEFEVDFSDGDGYKEVQELADALSFASKEIGATGHLQKELIANISHDLRTPLTMIKGYSEMMRDIPGENTPENIQAVIDETTRLSELVSDLMDLSKLQTGILKPVITIFDLSQTLRDALSRYDTLIRHKGYTIESDIDVGEVLVAADRTMILQVIYNLVGNAVNYSMGEDKRIRVSEILHDGVVRISVADNGEGIPPEKIKEIWDRYYRVDREHRRAVMGTGLGLSIVKGVMEVHQATYGVESAVGVGSIFWFELPVVQTQKT